MPENLDAHGRLGRAAATRAELAPVVSLILLHRDNASDPTPTQVGPVALRAIRLVAQNPVRSRARSSPVQTGYPDALQHGGELRTVPTLTGGDQDRQRLRLCSRPRCSFVVHPPRERPKAWSVGSAPPTPPGSSFCRSPFCAASGGTGRTPSAKARTAPARPAMASPPGSATGSRRSAAVCSTSAGGLASSPWAATTPVPPSARQSGPPARSPVWFPRSLWGDGRLGR